MVKTSKRLKSQISWQNVDKTGYVDNIGEVIKKMRENKAGRSFGTQGVFHVEKRNIHKSDRGNLCRDLWITWIILF